jgi:hypothetical protein
MTSAATKPAPAFAQRERIALSGPAIMLKPELAPSFGVAVVKREIEYSRSGASEFNFDEEGFSANLKIPLRQLQEKPL